MVTDEVIDSPPAWSGIPHPVTHPVCTSQAVVVAYLRFGVAAYWPLLPSILHKALSTPR